jgi:lipid-A-disaccharide synthase
MNEKYNDFSYVFHSTKEYSDLILSYIKKNNLNNCEVISDNKIKNHVLKKSIFAVSKSGTISLEICNSKIPSVILYKMGFINFLIIKMLVKTKFANIINIAAKKEIIPELLQSNCNPQNIFKVVSNYLENPSMINEQITKTQMILKDLKTNTSSSTLAANAINKYL